MAKPDDDSGDSPLGRQLKAEFDAALAGHYDPILILLKAHLYIENLLERIIVASLKRGDRVFENARLSFFQKLVLVDSLDTVPDNVITSVRHLNTLRNGIAHQIERSISEADVRRLGDPLGEVFQRARAQNHYSTNIGFNTIVAYVCGFLAAKVEKLETPTRPKTSEG